ncbi:AI-2E family transporter [Cohnella algarum]|uniref:AI-2E family transporter n=1 Tax=Cohnella algarum TaxID=2044859 RepID=UPI001968867D|nr:AI-2E family transporter [Cohnella algarum]MBN2984094.1 AI-2E family transporter [Cohnella algarum]
METQRVWSEKLRSFLFNSKFVGFLFVLLLVGLNILVLSKISYVFHPIEVLFKTVALPLLLTTVVYYLLNPIIDYLEKRNVKRIYSILALYLLIAGIITLAVTAVIPLVRQQIASLASNFPHYFEQFRLQIEEWLGSDFFEGIQETLNFDPAQLTANISERASSILNNTWSSVGGIVGTITEVVLSIVTVPFILFYLLKDRKKLTPFALGFVPTKLRDRFLTVMLEMNHQISSYIRGQIIVSFCIGCLLYIGYLIIGLDYSLTLAIVAACTSIVPYLGPAIAITPALIVALVTSPIMLVKMIVVWTVVQLVEGKFISPQIMGKTLNIHPITIIFVILTAGNLFGVLGVILAVPGYAVLKIVATHLFRWFKARSGLYESETANR